MKIDEDRSICWYLRLINSLIIRVRMSSIAGGRNEKFSRILDNNKMHLEKVKLCDCCLSSSATIALLFLLNIGSKLGNVYTDQQS